MKGFYGSNTLASSVPLGRDNPLWWKLAWWAQGGFVTGWPRPPLAVLFSRYPYQDRRSS